MATVASFNSFGSYSDVATEYYDTTRHPTCANFREASTAILRKWLTNFLQPENIVVETGAGSSIVSEIIDEFGTQVFLALCDKSPAMLNQSANRSANIRIIADVEKLPIRQASADLIVASLGDPYNTPLFWRECRRILRPDGQVFFTTPSFEWAHTFRGETGVRQMEAKFDLDDGS